MTLDKAEGRGGEGAAQAFRVVAFDTLDSTNEEARRRIRSGTAAAGMVIWALCQQAGRGRRGRRWESPAGNLHCSLILRPDCPPAAAAQLSLVAAVAVGEALEAGLGRGGRPQLKWPNDVLIGGRKVAGILLEADPDEAGGAGWLVVGVGVNIDHHPEGTDYPATSLSGEGAEPPDAAGVLELFLARFEPWYRRWCREGLAPVRAAWLERAVGIGLPVTVRLHAETVAGTFAGLDEDGTLLLDLVGGGVRRRVTAGDVFFPWMSGVLRT